MTSRKNDKIVSNVIVKEEVVFQGKKIIREKVEKKWTIPKIITNDIGFQMMFGFDPPTKTSKSKIDTKEYSINEII